MKSIRIQRKRTKRYKTPKNTLYVGRGSKWGNPIKLVGDMIYIDAGYRRKILDKWVLFYDDGGHTIGEVLYLYCLILAGYSNLRNPDLQYWSDKFKKNDINELKGKNLSCWCNPLEKCHADILLQLTNK